MAFLTAASFLLGTRICSSAIVFAYFNAIVLYRNIIELSSEKDKNKCAYLVIQQDLNVATYPAHKINGSSR